jgi:Transposase DDE domain
VSTLTKSPLSVARRALAVATGVLPQFAHVYSPRKFTQPQLFACLVLKTFLKTDYRGLVAHLADHSDLRAALGLKAVPHFTTPQKASRRLLRLPVARRLFAATVRRFLGRRRRVRRAAFDATGLDCGHASRYYLHRRRRGKDRRTIVYTRYAKLEVSVDCSTHLLLAALAGRGPRGDANRFVPLLDATLDLVRLDAALADGGYDSEPNHRHAREDCGVRSFIPAAIGRPTAKPPTGRYRRRMKQRLTKDYGGYGQRWQAETGFSMLKRRLATTVSGRGYWSQCRDLLLIAITYNLMLVALLWVFYKAVSVHFFDLPRPAARPGRQVHPEADSRCFGPRVRPERAAARHRPPHLGQLPVR